MSEIVRQHDRLGEILTEPQRPCDRTRDLSPLDRVGQTVSIVIVLEMNEDLGLELEPPKGPGMYDPIAISLIGTAVGVRRLVDESAR
jgi:hypothetical protein